MWRICRFVIWRAVVSFFFFFICLVCTQNLTARKSDPGRISDLAISAKRGDRFFDFRCGIRRYASGRKTGNLFIFDSKHFVDYCLVFILVYADEIVLAEHKCSKCFCTRFIMSCTPVVGKNKLRVTRNCCTHSFVAKISDRLFLLI